MNSTSMESSPAVRGGICTFRQVQIRLLFRSVDALGLRTGVSDHDVERCARGSGVGLIDAGKRVAAQNKSTQVSLDGSCFKPVQGGTKLGENTTLKSSSLASVATGAAAKQPTKMKSRARIKWRLTPKLSGGGNQRNPRGRSKPPFAVKGAALDFNHPHHQISNPGRTPGGAEALSAPEATNSVAASRSGAR